MHSCTDCGDQEEQQPLLHQAVLMQSGDKHLQQSSWNDWVLMVNKANVQRDEWDADRETDEAVWKFRTDCKVSSGVMFQLAFTSDIMCQSLFISITYISICFCISISDWIFIRFPLNNNNCISFVQLLCYWIQNYCIYMQWNINLKSPLHATVRPSSCM